MSSHSVAEAKASLSRLIDRALAGEDIVITRHGHPVIALKPVLPTPRAITDADLDWLDAHRVQMSPRKDAGQSVSEMRDEDWR